MIPGQISRWKCPSDETKSGLGRLSFLFPSASNARGALGCRAQEPLGKRYNSSCAIPPNGMKHFLFILMAVVCAGCSQAEQQPTNKVPAKAAASAPTTANALLSEDPNARQAKAIIQRGIEALGGNTWLTLRDREQQGRTYSLHHGQPSGAGTVFWSFSEFPDKERVELTKERDVTELFVGDKGYEITYRGVHPVEEKDLVDYLRRRRFSLDMVLRTWVNDPTVVILYDGGAIAAQHAADQVTLINSKDERVTLYFDSDSHLPIKKAFEWRDPVDRQKNLEEEIYENYRQVSGIWAPYNVTRYFNGDMTNQRFMNSVTVNEGLDQAMFDPNSGYIANKPVKK
jgi:hypothetical protein